MPTSPDPAPRWQVLVQPGGWAFETDGTASLGDAAWAAGIELPRSCRNGTCRACLCRALSGEVRYLIEWPGLSPDEKAEGWLLPCIARAASDLVLDVPKAKPVTQNR